MGVRLPQRLIPIPQHSHLPTPMADNSKALPKIPKLPWWRRVYEAVLNLVGALKSPTDT